MKIIKRTAAILVAGFLFTLIYSSAAFAQALPAKGTIVFHSFTAIYHLSRDASGHSLLTTEESILAEFPDNGGLFGISRIIPKNYQGHNVKVKVLSVSDVSGSPVPYKTTPDRNGNLVLTTGDPDIAVYGFQTYRITYQTQDVVNLDSQNDQFLLDVNGRGWDQPFDSVSGALYIPKSVASSLIGQPVCYIGYLTTTSRDCSTATENQSNQLVVTAKSDSQVGPSHGLVMKLNFKPATFTKSSNSLPVTWIVLISGLAIGSLLGVRWLSRRSR